MSTRSFEELYFAEKQRADRLQSEIEDQEQRIAEMQYELRKVIQAFKRYRQQHDESANLISSSHRTLRSVSPRGVSPSTTPAPFDSSARRRDDREVQSLLDTLNRENRELRKQLDEARLKLVAVDKSTPSRSKTSVSRGRSGSRPLSRRKLSPLQLLEYEDVSDMDLLERIRFDGKEDSKREILVEVMRKNLVLLHSQVDEYTRHMEELSKQKSDVEKERSILLQSDNFHDEIETLSIRLQDRAQKMEILERKFSTTLHEAENLRTQNRVLKDEVSQCKSELQDAEMSLLDLRRKNSEQAALSLEIRDLQERYQFAQREISQWKSLYEGLQHHFNDDSASNWESDRLKEMSDKLRRAEVDISSLKRENLVLADQLERMKLDRENQKKEIVKLSTRIHEMEDVSEMISELDILRRRNLELEEKAAVFMKEYGMDGVEFDRAYHLIASKKGQTPSVDSNAIARLQQSLSRSEVLIEDLQASLRSLEDANSSLLHEKMNLETLFESTKKQLADSHAGYKRSLKIYEERLRVLETELLQFRLYKPGVYSGPRDVARCSSRINFDQGENVFDVGILTVDLLGVVDEGDPNTRYWINIDFFVHEPQSTSAFYLRHNFLDFHSLFVVTMDSLFLEYICSGSFRIDLFAGRGLDFTHLATGLLPLRSLCRTHSELFDSVVLTSVNTPIRDLGSVRVHIRPQRLVRLVAGEGSRVSVSDPSAEEIDESLRSPHVQRVEASAFDLAVHPFSRNLLRASLGSDVSDNRSTAFSLRSSLSLPSRAALATNSSRVDFSPEIEQESSAVTNSVSAAVESHPSTVGMFNPSENARSHEGASSASPSPRNDEHESDHSISVVEEQKEPEAAIVQLLEEHTVESSSMSDTRNLDDEILDLTKSLEGQSTFVDPDIRSRASNYSFASSRYANVDYSASGPLQELQQACVEVLEAERDSTDESAPHTPFEASSSGAPRRLHFSDGQVSRFRDVSPHSLATAESGVDKTATTPHHLSTSVLPIRSAGIHSDSRISRVSSSSETSDTLQVSSVTDRIHDNYDDDEDGEVASSHSLSLSPRTLASSLHSSTMDTDGHLRMSTSVDVADADGVPTASSEPLDSTSLFDITALSSQSR